MTQFSLANEASNDDPKQRQRQQQQQSIDFHINNNKWWLSTQMLLKWDFKKMNSVYFRNHVSSVGERKKTAQHESRRRRPLAAMVNLLW